MPHRLLQLARETVRDVHRSPTRVGIPGLVGDALFACALRRLDPSVASHLCVARAKAHFEERPPHPSLHRGLAGLGFVLATYETGDDLLAVIDRALLASLADPEVDLPPASMQGGVAGIAMYASLRSGAATGRQLQRAALGALAAAASPSDDGLLWHTPPAYARARGIDVRGEQVTEFGMVHGIGGALVALAALAMRGHDDAADLARGGLRAAWAWARRGTNHFGRVEFGAHGADGTREFDEGRWCVGDHGVLRACWLAATTVGDGGSAERALGLLRESAGREAAGTMPGAPGRIDLCCGAASIAQVYLRMHRETGEPVFRAAVDRRLSACAETVERLREPSFAYGRRGALLALLSGASAEPPRWDAILGISLPRSVHEADRLSRP